MLLTRKVIRGSFARHLQRTITAVPTLSPDFASKKCDPEGTSIGFATKNTVHWNTVASSLYQMAIERGEASVAADGPLVVKTFPTGRCPDDKFVVCDDSTKDNIWWAKNRRMTPVQFEALRSDIMEHMANKPDKSVFAQDLYGGADVNNRIGVRVVTELAWQALFIQNLLRVPTTTERSEFAVEYTIVVAPTFSADPVKHGTRSKTVIALDFARKTVLIAGTSYAGEIKKSVFTLLNYLLPPKGIMPMHASVNVGKDGNSAIFFGLSGTGKTTLSTDPDRPLLGDDEHGWTDQSVFNFEGGCYAKMIHLSPIAEPEIYSTTKRFGTVLENVVMDQISHELDLDDASLAENSRGAYPIRFIPGAILSGVAGKPTNVIMLTCDAFGVLPPMSKLSPSQAEYHFLSGYTAKVAGTESGLGKEPQATFSTCFGAPFMPRHPSVYGDLLRNKLMNSQVNCWLVNTGWSGGPYGVGHRMSIKATRKLLSAALDGSLDNAEMRVDEHFGFQVPCAVEGVDASILDPKKSWKDSTAYDAQANKLVKMFVDNFKTYEPYVEADVLKAAPSTSTQTKGTNNNSSTQ